MKYAIAKSGSDVSHRFGHCDGFDTFVKQGSLVGEFKFLQNPGHRPGVLPQILIDEKIDILIVDEIGDVAKEILERSGIKIISGIKGCVLDVVGRITKGEIND
jgi:predicted Fe-Mo cluster-binding NifX family protein